MSSYTPLLRLLTFKNGDDPCLLVNTISPKNISPDARLCALPHLNKASKIDLEFTGFDFIEVSSGGEKYLGGDIYIKEVVDGATILTLISSPKYLISSLNCEKSEQNLARTIKELLKRDWSACFSEALNNSLKDNAINSDQPEDTNHLSTKSFVLFSSFIKKSLRNKKKLFFVLIAFAVIILNLAMWSFNTSQSSGRDSEQASLKSAEQMAVEQDEILNKAFKEIGIDREKLASDMSCFTE